MKKWVFIYYIPIFLLLVSCFTVEKNVRYLKPAEITIPGHIRNIAILSTGNQFKDEMYDILFNVFGREEVRTRFNLIDRNNLETILREQNLYNRDEFDDRTAAELGQLSGADAIVIGSVKNIQDSSNFGVVVLQRRYFERYEINKAGVRVAIYRYVDESIPSIIKTYLFTVDIRMLDISTGTLIHNEQKTYKAQFENYIDNHPNETVYVVRRNAKFMPVFPTIEELLISSGKEFADYFAKKVAPFSVVEPMSFEIISNDETNLKFIKFIENDLYDEALSVMLDNISKIDGIEKTKIRAKHYYNIGCVYESQNELEKSLEFYSKSVKDDSTRLHLAALKAIKDRIDEKKKLDSQLKKENKKGDDW
jgi:hypothetical protein